MSDISASPYINFQGHAREAMDLYHTALGGTLELLTFNPDGAPLPAGPNDPIMHAALTVEGLTIMGSDGMSGYPASVGDNVAIALSGSDTDQLTKAFMMLSDGGQMKQPLKAESWGASFGYFTDKFGINWMVNIQQ